MKRFFTLLTALVLFSSAGWAISWPSCSVTRSGSQNKITAGSTYSGYYLSMALYSDATLNGKLPAGKYLVTTTSTTTNMTTRAGSASSSYQPSYVANMSGGSISKVYLFKVNTGYIRVKKPYGNLYITSSNITSSGGVAIGIEIGQDSPLTGEEIDVDLSQVAYDNISSTNYRFECSSANADGYTARISVPISCGDTWTWDKFSDFNTSTWLKKNGNMIEIDDATGRMWEENGNRYFEVDFTSYDRKLYHLTNYSSAAGTITVTAGTHGQIRMNDGEWSSTISNSFEAGQALTIQAKADEGYVFTQWNDGNTDNPRTITVNGDKTYTAQFGDKSTPVLGAYSYNNSKHHISFTRQESEGDSPYMTWYGDENNEKRDLMRFEIWDEEATGNNAIASKLNWIRMSFWVDDYSIRYAGTMGPKEGVYTITQAEVFFSASEAASYGYKNAIWGLDSEYHNKTILGFDPSKPLDESDWSTSMGDLWTTSQNRYVAYACKKNLSYGTPYEFEGIPNGTKVVVERGKDDHAYIVATLANGRVLFTLGEPAAPITTHTITINPTTNGSLTVVDTDDNDKVIANGDEVAEGHHLTVTATPAEHYHFGAWTNDGAASIEVTGDKTIGATFAINTNLLTWNLDGGQITTPGTEAGQVAYGTELTAPTVEKAGYNFTAWNPAVPATMPDAAATYTAQWEEITYVVTIDKNEDYGTVSATSIQNVPQGSVITVDGNALTINGTIVTATPTEATAEYTYAFSNWTGIPESGNVTENMTITANFTRTTNQYTITISATNGTVVVKNGETVVNNGDKVNYGTNLTVTATPATGYHFVAWTNSSIITTSEQGVVPVVGTITISSDATLGATFESNKFMLYDDKNEGDQFYTDYESLVDIAGQTVTYVRTFQDGWSVFSLPFDFSLMKNKTHVFAGKVLSLDKATYSEEGYLSLFFTPVSRMIMANTPYILYTTSTIVNPEFENVTLKTLEQTTTTINLTAEETGFQSGTIDFINTICRQALPMGKNTIYMSANKLYYPAKTIYMRAFRGYFNLATDDIKHVSVRIMVDGEDVNVKTEDESQLQETKKYFENDMLIIERNGKKYNVQGTLLE